MFCLFDLFVRRTEIDHGISRFLTIEPDGRKCALRYVHYSQNTHQNNFDKSCWKSFFFFFFFFCRNDSKSPQLSRTLLSIFSDFSSAVVLVISIFSLISNFTIHFSKFLGTVSWAPTIFIITCTFRNFGKFHTFTQFFDSLTCVICWNGEVS